MKRKQFFISAIAAVFAVSTVTAQEDTRDVLKSYSFIEAQGGLQMTATDAPMSKLFTPTAAISFGHYVFPSMGFRFHINGMQAKSGFSDLEQYYKWKYVTTSADLLVNLTNLFNENPRHLLNVIFVGGVGLNYAWDNDELKNLNIPYGKTPFAWKDDRYSYNLRAGLRLETDVTKVMGISFEIATNNLCDRFNSKTNNAGDWMFTAMLGVSYRFGKRFAKPTPILVPVVQDATEVKTVSMAPTTYTAEEYKPEPQPKQEAKLVVKTDKLHENIFYAICMSNPKEGGIEQLQKVARFMEKHKDAKIQIVGYADKDTGNPDVNMKYSKQRAIECKDVLVKSYGCNPDNIIIDSKGDTVQPFDENEKNRCVIIDSEAKYTVEE
jgi:outer membrane protein OmpA-like peptidoglycan-associated protein